MISELIEGFHDSACHTAGDWHGYFSSYLNSLLLRVAITFAGHLTHPSTLHQAASISSFHWVSTVAIVQHIEWGAVSFVVAHSFPLEEIRDAQNMFLKKGMWVPSSWHAMPNKQFILLGHKMTIGSSVSDHSDLVCWCPRIERHVI